MLPSAAPEHDKRVRSEHDETIDSGENEIPHADGMIGKLIDFNEFGYPPVASEFNSRIELNNDYGNWMGKSQEQSNCKSQEHSNFLISSFVVILFATSLPAFSPGPTPSRHLATWTRKGKPTKKKITTSRMASHPQLYKAYQVSPGRSPF